MGRRAVIAGGRGFVLYPGAEETIIEVAHPALAKVAAKIASAIPGNVPVHHGTMQRLYKPTVVEAGKSVHVAPGSPFWHWLEYGTRFNTAYRPIENTVRGLGIRYEAQ